MTNLLPPNATPLERNLAAVNARLGELPVELRALLRPDTCPAQFLPWLAQALAVDSWDTGWSEEQKRETIRASLKVHRVKGTIGAVRRALSALGVDVRLQEWFNQIPAAAPYTYRLLLGVNQVGIDLPFLQTIQKVVAAAKNLRSHQTTISLTVTTQSDLVTLAATGTGHEITVMYAAPDVDLLLEGAANGAAATEAAVDALHRQLHTILPTRNYW